MEWGDWIALGGIVMAGVGALLKGLSWIASSAFSGMKDDIAHAKSGVENLRTDMEVLKTGVEQLATGQKRAEEQFDKVWDKISKHDEKIYDHGVQLARLRGRSEGGE